MAFAHPSAPVAPDPTYTILRETDVTSKLEWNYLAATFTVFLMADMIDYEKGVVTEFCHYKLSDTFSEVLSSKKAETRACLYMMAWVSVLNQGGQQLFYGRKV